jgi:hypothetical protein
MVTTSGSLMMNYNLSSTHSQKPIRAAEVKVVPALARATVLRLAIHAVAALPLYDGEMRVVWSGRGERAW